MRREGGVVVWNGLKAKWIVSSLHDLGIRRICNMAEAEVLRRDISIMSQLGVLLSHVFTPDLQALELSVTRNTCSYDRFRVFVSCDSGLIAS